jgi:dolichol kinase
MSRGDIIGLVLSYLYAFGLLFTVEAIGKQFKWHQEFTRKIIHIGAGLWIWGILYFFDHWYFGIIPFATFIVLNYVFYRQQSFKAMDTTESTPGTVYFAISITLLFVWLWRTGEEVDRVPIAAAAVMAMTLGDAFASIIGRRWGKHTYTVFGHTRSWEGTAAMAVTSLVGIVLTLSLLPGSVLSPNSVVMSGSEVIVLSLVGAAAAAVFEALSPAGIDNLSVPLLTGLVMVLLSSLLQLGLLL